jgi:hypothetical protein
VTHDLFETDSIPIDGVALNQRLNGWSGLIIGLHAGPEGFLSGNFNHQGVGRDGKPDEVVRDVVHQSRHVSLIESFHLVHQNVEQGLVLGAGAHGDHQDAKED